MMNHNEKRVRVQSDCTTSIRDNGFNGWIEVAPRVGKSKIIIDAIRDKSDWNITVSSPYDNIRENWLKEFDKWGLDFKVNSICSRSLSTIDEDLDLLIIDELQTTSFNMIKIIKEKKPKRILAASGYLDDASKQLFSFQFGIKYIYQYTLEDAIRDDIISNFEIIVVSCELDNFNKIIPAGSRSNPFMTTERRAYDYYTKLFDQYRLLEPSNPARYGKAKMGASGKRSNLIYEAPSKIHIAKRIIDGISERCLNFTARTKVADELTEYTYHSKHPKGTKKNPIKTNLERFIDEEIDKITVCQMVSMGITIHNLKHSVVHQIQSNSEMSIQKILRICNVEEENRIARIWITQFKGTVDEAWTIQALQSIPADKIKHVDLKDI